MPPRALVLNPHGSDETSFITDKPAMLIKSVLNPHGSDETKDFLKNGYTSAVFLTHTVQMKLCS